MAKKSGVMGMSRGSTCAALKTDRSWGLAGGE